MRSLLVSTALVTLAFSFGCEPKPEDVEEAPAAEKEAPEAAKDQALAEEKAAADDEAAAEEKPEEEAPKLVGAEWSVQELGGEAIVEDTEPIIFFSKDGKLNGKASCNSFLGSYEVDGAKLKITTEGTTRMVCPDPIVEQEELFLKTLAEIDGFEIDDAGMLKLNAGDKTVVTAR